jgi:hypothetical protein
MLLLTPPLSRDRCSISADPLKGQHIQTTNNVSYAQVFGQKVRWVFLSGNPTDMDLLTRHGFLQPQTADF